MMRAPCQPRRLRLRLPSCLSLPLTMAAFALVAGCAAGPGTTAQLDRMTKAQADGRDAANAAEVPEGDCAGGATDPACARIQVIRGRACLALARAEAAPGAACPPPTTTARQHLDCAVAAYAQARSAAPAGSTDAANVAENAARAQYCAAGYRSPAEGLALLREARAGLGGLPPTPERDLLNASAALSIAQRSAVPAADRCGAAREAARLVARVLEAAPAPSVADAARATGTAARQQAATLPNCTGA